MEKLKTPFGEIDILIDGKPITYNAQKGANNIILWPDVQNRFQIVVKYVPDGKKHNISCVFSSTCSYKRGVESGENLECQSFYNVQRIKMSIGVECEARCISDKYDYDAIYLDNGMSYVIIPETKTEKYVFGIAWIDNVGWDDPIDDEHSRDIQTWFAADPTLPL